MVLLHVTQVYLNELQYLDLEMDLPGWQDRRITRCGNFDNEEDGNRKYIAENVLYTS